MLVAIAGNGGNVVAIAGGELDKAQADEARAVADLCKNILNANAMLVHLHEVNLHTLLLEIEPGIDVAGKFAFGGENGIACSPAQPIGYVHQAVTCAGGHSQLVMPGV